MMEPSGMDIRGLDYLASMGDMKVITKKNILGMVAKLMETNVSENIAMECEILLNLTILFFRFTWDPKVKKISTTLFSFDTLYAVLATNIPSLNIVASDDASLEMFRTYTAKMMAKLKNETKNYNILNVEGGHDVHLTNPQSFVGNIAEFLNKDFNICSKL